MIKKFSRAQFEAALPVHKETGEQLWKSEGIQNGEFTYSIQVSRGIAIQIRSSMRADGHAADTGKDSIRLWFYNIKTGKPHGSKLSTYITRVAGWEQRLIKQLRILYARSLKMTTCKVCNGPKAIFKAKPGHLFQACPEHFNQSYESFQEA